MTNIFYELVDNDESIEAFLPFFTQNVAQLMNFHQKGRIKKGCDADIVVLNKQNRIEHVMAMGHWHVKHQQQIKKGTFE
jgi:beta-aspartyl-dipeptidase (metallo-type)